jgi:hypothetical protein
MRAVVVSCIEQALPCETHSGNPVQREQRVMHKERPSPRAMTASSESERRPRVRVLPTGEARDRHLG